MSLQYRKTSQYILPAVRPEHKPGCYDIYPVFNIGDGNIFRGLSSLADAVAGEELILIDGYEGVFFDNIRTELDRLLRQKFNIAANWISTVSFLKSEEETDLLVSPFLGGNDPLFGKRTELTLDDFFTDLSVASATVESGKSPVIIYGTGAAIFSRKGFLIYLDLPKNELQFRSRAGTVTNVGASRPADHKQMYKRFYFVDWVVLNRHKKNILERIDILADAQRPDDITWLSGEKFRESLSEMSINVIRARPWFEPGSWGGSWIKDRIVGVNREVPNYAWSFELISPENGLILESSGLMAEFSFDFLMYAEGKNILGDSYYRFGTEFPIRFDFLDTFDGGNLSVQCHPRQDYMKENFGEDFTQEESYYILDTKDNARVYLGFQEDIDSEAFRDVLEASFTENKPVEVEKYVQAHPAKKHDLFLIPYGTIHGSGKDNLVLEISTTPYIFTFKMYDWLRPDLDGGPRPLNIQRGMENLFFDRKGERVKNELISKPVMIEEGDGWQLYHLPTHASHLYDVFRYHFTKPVEIQTGGRCFVMNLVEGERIIVKTNHGREHRFSYAETFIIPAAAGLVEVINESDKQAILVAAFVK